MLKNMGILSSGVMCSRFLGVVRDVLIAKYFGTSPALEAYIVAFRLPNVLRSLFGEGFSDAVATPVLSEYQNDEERMTALGNHLFSAFLVILFVVTVLGIIFSRPLVILVAPGFLKRPEALSLASSFTRITFFYLLFMGLVAVISSLLYARRKFAMAAFNPALFNICLIVGIVFFKRYLHVYILVISVWVAGIVQFLSLYFYARSRRIQLSFQLKGAFADSDVARMVRLFIPRIWASAVYHFNVFIDTIYSSLSWIVGQGGLAAIYYSNRIIQFPLALIALSISTVAVVDLSGLHKEEKLDEFRELLSFSLQNILFFTIPIACVFLFMSREIIEVLYFRGSFGGESLTVTVPVLFYYSLGLVFFCGIKLLVTSFYSLKDTVTPAKTATAALILNALLSAVLMFPLKIGGVALASSIAGAFNFFLLYRALCRKIGSLDWHRLRQELWRICLVSLITAVAFKTGWIFLPGSKYLRFFSGMVMAAAVFFFFSDLLAVSSYRYYKQWILKRK